MRDSHVTPDEVNIKSFVQGARASWLAKDATVLA
jgi:hypothetical protein